MAEGFTTGEALVGLDFNPSGDEKVHKVKQLCAELLDMMIAERRDVYDKDEWGLAVKDRILNESITRIMDAQMWAVKGLTFKD